MFSRFLILIFLLTTINSVRAEKNSNNSINSFTQSLTDTLNKTFKKTETETKIKTEAIPNEKNNKQIFKDQNTKIILNKFFTNYGLVGEVNYTHLFWNLYDAKLITETGNFNKNKFALIFKYNTEISKKSVVKETLNQLKKQKEYNEEEFIELTTLLNNTFKDIKVGDTFIGIKENDTAYFYFENEKVLETKDLEFINLFFDIWLRENSQNPAFTKKLLGQK